MANSKKPEKVTNSSEQKLVSLILGTGKTVNKRELRMAREIKEIKAKGRIVDIPQEFI